MAGMRITIGPNVSFAVNVALTDCCEMSVCLSVKLVICDKMKESCAIWKTIYTSFMRRRMVGGRPLLPEILGQLVPVGAKLPIFNRYSLVAPQP